MLLFSESNKKSTQRDRGREKERNSTAHNSSICIYVEYCKCDWLLLLAICHAVEMCNVHIYITYIHMHVWHARTCVSAPASADHKDSASSQRNNNNSNPDGFYGADARTTNLFARFPAFIIVCAFIIHSQSI